MDLEKIKADIDKQFEYKVNSIVNDLQSAMKNKELVKEMIRKGLYQPVLPYYSFIGSFRNFYASLPLDKPLFHRVLQDMERLGWVAGKVEVDNNSAGCTLDYTDPDVQDPVKLSVTMRAYGVGVACKIVELKPQQNYEQGVYEWVCEKGAEEEAL